MTGWCKESTALTRDRPQFSEAIWLAADHPDEDQKEVEVQANVEVMDFLDSALQGYGPNSALYIRLVQYNCEISLLKIQLRLAILANQKA